MNFNFKDILEMFNGHWRFIVVSLMIGVAAGYFVIVPIAKSFIESDTYSCGPCLDENKELVGRLIEMSAILREYTELKKAQENMNRSVSEMIVLEAVEDTVRQQPIQVVDEANQALNKERDKLIEKAIEVAEID